MNRIEINVETGERTVVPLTAAEIAAANVATAAENAARTRDAADAKDINKIRAVSPKLFRAAMIYLGSLHGKSPTQVKAGIRAAYDALP